MSQPKQKQEQIGKQEAQENKEASKLLADQDCDAWIDYYKIKNEKGDPIDWYNHQFQIDIYNDQSKNLVVMKAAQIGLSTLEIIKNFRDAESNKMDIIYTLPTDQDVGVFVGGKVNRIIANNPHFEVLTKDKDTIEQKRVGKSMIYFRGTWSKKAAIMVTADRLVHDEKDSSKQDVVADYQARLQHSKFKQTHVFSHPSVTNSGVHIEWKISDQKEWFITCPHCQYQQILTWNAEDPKKMSINMEKKRFECKKCHGVLENKDRRIGEWKPRKGKENAEYSGYRISLLMAPWVSAKDIIKKYNEVVEGKQTMDFFYNKILGLPYSGGGNSVTEEMIKGAVTKEENLMKGRMVIGVDTGIKLRYTYGNKQGLLGYGEMTDYMPDETNKLALNQTLEYFLKVFPDSVMVIDQGGDIIGARKLRKAYPGRVFLCHYATDRKTMQLIRWGKSDEEGNVTVDRNRTIQLLVDFWRDKRIRIYRGTKEDWHNFWLHWSHIYRVKEENNLGVEVYKWLRSNRDDWVHATLYWYVGITRFGMSGGVVHDGVGKQPDSYLLNPDGTVDFDPAKLFNKNKPTEDEEEEWWADEEGGDWRN